jgi:hypothetical protein
MGRHWLHQTNIDVRRRVFMMLEQLQKSSDRFGVPVETICKLLKEIARGESVWDNRSKVFCQGPAKRVAMILHSVGDSVDLVQ